MEIAKNKTQSRDEPMKIVYELQSRDKPMTLA